MTKLYLDGDPFKARPDPRVFLVVVRGVGEVGGVPFRINKGQGEIENNDNFNLISSITNTYLQIQSVRTFASKAGINR